MSHIGWANTLIIAIFVFVILLVALFWNNPDKATKMMARFALFFRSVEESRSHTHEREGDEKPHHHKRASITDFAKTMVPTSVKKRRSGEEK